MARPSHCSCLDSSNFNVIDGNDAKPRDAALERPKEGLPSYAEAWNRIQVGEGGEKKGQKQNPGERNRCCVGPGLAEGGRNSQESRTRWTALGVLSDHTGVFNDARYRFEMATGKRILTSA